MTDSSSPHSPGPPYLGAAYYPEAWPKTDIPRDISMMKEAGLNCVRIGEFAWSTTEPREGEYHFEWLHEVVGQLGDAGIAIVMGTPTATPPIWLTEKHPDTLFVNHDGSVAGHGGRRHYDPCSPTYRRYCVRIAELLGREFGRDKRIVGWQIDNELFPHNFPNFAEFPICKTEACRLAFVKFLEKRFGAVEALNEAWCTTLWSQTYERFGQVPYAEFSVWQHPSLKTIWREFMDWAYTDFCNAQADVLHKVVEQPVGTNMIMVPGINYHRMAQKLDVVQFDDYHYHGNTRTQTFWFDLIRTAKNRPFWNIETGANWSGSIATSGYSEKGWCIANSWIPIALGGEMVSYWLWRQHRAGQELTHGCVLQSTGRPMHNFHEIQELSRGFTAARDFLNGAPPAVTGLAIHWSTLAYHTLREQPLVNGFDYQADFQRRIYQPLVQAQWRPDVIHPCNDLSPYKVVLTPFLPCLDEDGLRDRLLAWIENGGIWIAGPLTDIRDRHGAKPTGDSPFGSLEEWGGVRAKYQIPGEPRQFQFTWDNGKGEEGALWYDGLELAGAEALATYDEYPLEKLAAATMNKVGRGKVIVMGTLPGPESYAGFLARAAAWAGMAPPPKASSSLLAVPRRGEAGEGVILVEMEGKPANYHLEREGLDLLTGESMQGDIDIPPYGVHVFRYAD